MKSNSINKLLFNCFTPEVSLHSVSGFRKQRAELIEKNFVPFSSVFFGTGQKPSKKGTKMSQKRDTFENVLFLGQKCLKKETLL